MTAGRDQRGAATLMVVVVAMFVVALTAIGVTAAAYVVAVHRARTAADLAALAAAHAYQGGAGDACRTAAEVSWANGARVESCFLEGRPGAFALTVATAVEVPLRLPGAPPTVHGSARAGTPAG